MPTKSVAKKRAGTSKATGAPKAKVAPKTTGSARGGAASKKAGPVGKSKTPAAAAKKPARAAPMKIVAKRAATPAMKAGASAARLSKKPSGGSVTSTKTAAATIYSVHPGVQMMVKWASELKSKTGRTLDEWVALLKKDAPAAFEDRVAFLKSRHAMGTNAAWWIAERADGKGAEDLDPDLYLAAASKYVDEQYEGKKAKLRPLYESLLSTLLSMDARAKACPCKTMVPIYFDHVVAQLKATTNTRIDLGLALGDTKGAGRLIETGGYAKKDRITHRIEVMSEAGIDGFVKDWIRTAYARG